MAVFGTNEFPVSKPASEDWWVGCLSMRSRMHKKTHAQKLLDFSFNIFYFRSVYLVATLILFIFLMLFMFLFSLVLCFSNNYRNYVFILYKDILTWFLKASLWVFICSFSFRASIFMNIYIIANFLLFLICSIFFFYLISVFLIFLLATFHDILEKTYYYLFFRLLIK